MNIGDLSILSMQVGNTQALSACLGTQVVWTQDSPTPPGPTPDPYASMYLTFDIIEDGTLYWVLTGNTNPTNKRTIYYSIDGGETWSSIESNTWAAAPTINVLAGDMVMFKGDNSAYAASVSTYNSFYGSTAVFNVYGNIMSLINSTGFSAETTFSSNSPFAGLFRGCTGLTSAENLVLPVTAVITACYNNMFSGCTSLTTAPALPATTLALNCYGWMFNSCTSLTTAPELPATTLANSCYVSMFNGCTSLTTITCLATDITASNCLVNWVSGVAANGTFTKHPNMSSWPSGANGIPTGWTVQDYNG